MRRPWTTLLNGFNVRVTFTNGEERHIELTKYIESGPIFAPVRDDPTFFRFSGVEGGTIAWRAARAAQMTTTRL